MLTLLNSHGRIEDGLRDVWVLSESAYITEKGLILGDLVRLQVLILWIWGRLGIRHLWSPQGGWLQKTQECPDLQMF